MKFDRELGKNNKNIIRKATCKKRMTRIYQNQKTAKLAKFKFLALKIVKSEAFQSRSQRFLQDCPPCGNSPPDVNVHCSVFKMCAYQNWPWNEQGGWALGEVAKVHLCSPEHWIHVSNANIKAEDACAEQSWFLSSQLCSRRMQIWTHLDTRCKSVSASSGLPWRHTGISVLHTTWRWEMFNLFFLVPTQFGILVEIWPMFLAVSKLLEFFEFK